MKFLLAALIVGSATPAFADNFPVRLNDGANWTITAAHTRKSDDGNPAQNWSLTTVKRLTWHAGKDGGAPALTVTPVSATPGEGSPPEVARARSFAIPATVSIREGLEPGEILNLDEVRAEFVRLVPNAKGADVRLIDASAKAMIATELAMASHGQGIVLKPNSAVSGEAAMPNPFGGPPLRGIVTATLESLDQPTGTAKIAWSQAVDPEDFKAMAASVIAESSKRQLPPEKLAEMRSVMKDAAYDNRLECKFEIDTRTGLARRADCTATNTMTIQGKTQQVVDTWAITQTAPDNA